MSRKQVSMTDTQLIDLFQRARRDDSLAVIEGVQALKHAIRFKAPLLKVVTSDLQFVVKLLSEIAADTADFFADTTLQVDESVFERLSPQPPRTKVIALAKRRVYHANDFVDKKPVLIIEDPRDLENIGAVIRVSAAADAAGVIITGPVDIWHPAIIRGAAGLHYALPVLNMEFDEARALGRDIFALDPTGQDIEQTIIPHNAMLLFGTERHGISQTALEASNEIVRLPMKAGVSSLNLATSVAATLYSLKG